jgi:hypothetical protein
MASLMLCPFCIFLLMQNGNIVKAIVASFLYGAIMAYISIHAIASYKNAK